MKMYVVFTCFEMCEGAFLTNRMQAITKYLDKFSLLSHTDDDLFDESLFVQYLAYWLFLSQ